ncbi:hypothetical protein [Amycolatopsis alkalitolerans]|uniref:Uncharacterized protein n=1 Tax=Amycolatopsis alkalitolerans TaxID=2547244 RepID=A0A5C4LVF5_9PSEU|nr:hypothetical protein [Amycolatopsis alkalitolerans]TNC23335.1 hypothetical protein FG385_21560 [Amycolatopsis alkalitolerans]
MPRRSPFRWAARFADWFEQRGVYVPGEDNHTVDPWRDFGWLIVVWVIAVGAFILFFALAT